MGDIQHANAKTTPGIRKETQESSEPIVELAARLSLKPKTVTKWRNTECTQKRNVVPLLQILLQRHNNKNKSYVSSEESQSCH